MGKRRPLPLCPNCGMDSGVRICRKYPDGTELWACRCECCGFQTRFCRSKSGATVEWKKGIS